MGGVLAVGVVLAVSVLCGWGPSCVCYVGGVLAVGVLCGWTPSCVVWVGS